MYQIHKQMLPISPVIFLTVYTRIIHAQSGSEPLPLTSELTEGDLHRLTCISPFEIKEANKTSARRRSH